MQGESREIRWSWLGSMPFEEANRLQEELREEIKTGRGSDHLLLLEHEPPVITLGRNANASELLADADWLRERGIEVVECDRGGQLTYHGPGQLIGWPVLNLSPDRRDVRRFVRDLQTVLVRVLHDHGVEAEGRPMPQVGVWTDAGKIASIGIHLSRWITTHGFALNVTTELDHFRGIVPCGLPEVEMVSLEGLAGEAPELPEVAETVVRHFGGVFQRPMVRSQP
ncbi:MAG: lipoyl(octanoyl) transferase LipB [Thermoanaerobaculia bacterium]|nr:lipoyl(octanoyl) transferase LipB [Thermoanaerobaculia bacterium]